MKLKCDQEVQLNEQDYTTGFYPFLLEEKLKHAALSLCLSDYHLLLEQI